MTPKNGSVQCLVIAFFGSELCKLIVCHDARLREALHDPSDIGAQKSCASMKLERLHLMTIYSRKRFFGNWRDLYSDGSCIGVPR